MTLIDKETICAEIERRLIGYDPDYTSAGKELDELIKFLDTLPDEPDHLEEALKLVAEYNLQPYRDGNAWCILLGKDIQSGICGFGDTRLDAMLEFKKEYDSYVKRTHLYPAMEQPVELEKEIDDYIEGCLGGLEGQEIASCARHFYELGLNSKK